MKIYFILLTFVVLAASDLFPSLMSTNGTLDSYSAKVIGSLKNTYFPNFVVFRNEFVAYFGPSNSVGILKRNATGGYDLVSKWDFPVVSSLKEYYLMNGHLAVSTDGWVSLTVRVIKTTLYLLKVADNGTITEVQTPTIPTNILFEASQFHSDGYLIGVGSYSGASPIKSADLHRIQLVNGNWTLTDSFTLAEKIYPNVEDSFYGAMKYVKAVFQLTGNFFIASDLKNAHIYELSTNQSSWIWSIKESIPFSITNFRADSLAWNGNDAIMGGFAFAQTMLMKIKSNGTWTTQGRVGQIDDTPSSSSDGNYNLLGYFTLLLNEDTFLVSSPNVRQQIAVVQRQNGTWWLTGVIVPSNTSQTFFGATLAVTDQHLLIDGQTDLNAVPLCVFDPIDYDCPPIVELESCDIGDFKAEIACTSKSTPECTLPVTTTVTDQHFANNTIFISFKMQRFGTVPRQATVGLRCGKSSSPSTGPSTTTPSTNTSPDASAPRNSDGIASGSENNRRVVSDLFALLTFVLFLAC